MDCNHQPEEKLDNLPKFEKFQDDDYFDHYWGKNFPYTRLKRWAESQEGNHIDGVFHKFVNLKWLLPEYRTKQQFRNHVEVDTFIGDDNKIYYYSKYSWRTKSAMPVEGNIKTVYVHPKTKLICVYHPQTLKSYKSKWLEERNKKVRILGAFDQFYKDNGIWYHVKAEPVIDFTKTSLHDARLGRKKSDSILLETTNSDGSFVKITLKRQLNGKELKKFNLIND
jgi:hypothetical protein